MEMFSWTKAQTLGRALESGCQSPPPPPGAWLAGWLLERRGSWQWQLVTASCARDPVPAPSRTLSLTPNEEDEDGTVVITPFLDKKTEGQK